MKTKLVTAAALALALPLALAVASPSVAAPAPAAIVTVKGHVRTPTGKPIAGVQVSVYADGSNGHHVVSRAETSRTGRYAIRIPKSVRAYQLKVLDYGDADADHGDGEWAPVLRRFAFSGSSVRENQVLHHGARVSGRVYDRDGKPVGAGVAVGVAVKGASARGSETITRADGTYRITNAPAGSGIVGFRSPRTAESTRWYTSSSIYGTRDDTKSTLVKLAYGRATSGIDFRFSYLGRISGSVTVDGDHPGEEGSPVSVRLLDAEGDELSDEIANPGFRFSDLSAGRYYLEFHPTTAEDALVTEYYKNSATLANAVPLVITRTGNAITGLKASLSSR